MKNSLNKRLCGLTFLWLTWSPVASVQAQTPTPSPTASPSADAQQMESILKQLSPEQLQQLRERLGVPKAPNPPAPTSSPSPMTTPEPASPETSPSGSLPEKAAPQRMPNQAEVRVLDSLERAQSSKREARFKELRRFGSSFFARSKEELASSDEMQIPDDYQLQPGDQMSLTAYNVHGGEDTGLVQVDEKGKMLVPGAGPVKVAGLTKPQLDARLDQMLRSQFPNMRVATQFVKIRKIRVFVLGESERPGSYLMNPNSTVLDALLHAGGPSESGSYRKIQLERGGTVIGRFDLYHLLRQGTSGSPKLRSGDRIFVPLTRPEVSLAGEVMRPAIYELAGEKSLAQVIQLAGGLKPSAYAPNLKVERVAANRSRRVLDIAWKDASKTAVEPGDFVYANPVLEDLSHSVYIDGSVRRPGWYQLHPGMRVSQLLRQAEGMLDGTYAGQSELFRLVSRDQPLKMMGLDLGRAMRGDPTQDMTLQAEDRLVVYSRQEALVDKERVRIQGEVKGPGEYGRFSNMRIRDLVTMAGGITPEASMRAEIARPGANGRLTLIPVDLDGALAASDSPANLELRDLDVLVIRKELHQKRWPASVLLIGEFNKPGEYSVDPDRETLADLVRRAGGPTELAYPRAAVLTRRLPEILSKERQTLTQDIFADLQEIAREIAIVENMRLGRKFSTLGAAPQVDFSQLNSAAIIPPRKLDSVLSTGRVPVNFAEILSSGQGDPRVKDGDVLYLPQKPEMVILSGAVVMPSPIIWHEGWDIENYVRQGGGFAEDAAEDRVLLLRVNGSLISAREAPAVEPGDLILVPPRALVARPDAFEQFLSILQVAANGAFIYGLFNR